MWFAIGLLGTLARASAHPAGRGRTTLLRSASSSSSSSSKVKSLLEPSDVLGAPADSFRFVDGSFHMNKTRDAASEYQKERLPGARWFDVDAIADKTSSLPHMLPSDDDFGEAMDSLGLCNDDHVVVYTTQQCFSAARVWWTFRAFGHSRVSILNGGLEGWRRSGGEIETSPAPTAIGSSSSKAPYKARLDKRLVVDWREVRGIVDTGSAQIFDARSLARFLAEAPEPRPGLIGGHIPGSLSLPYTALVQPDDPTTFRTPTEMRDALQDAGVVMGSRLVATCGSGVTAAVIAFALEQMGKDLASVPIYDGSWSEWGDAVLSKERGLPIVTKK